MVVYPSLSLLIYWLPQILLNLMSLSRDKTVSSTFQAPVWSLGTQLDIRGSLEFLKSKLTSFLLDKFLIGNGQGDADE